jgi:hypothetical protein
VKQYLLVDSERSLKEALIQALKLEPVKTGAIPESRLK